MPNPNYLLKQMFTECLVEDMQLKGVSGKFKYKLFYYRFSENYPPGKKIMVEFLLIITIFIC